MLRRCALPMLLASAVCTIDATTIVAVRRGNTVVVAADSAVTTRTGSRLHMRCKVQVFPPGLLVATAGLVENPVLSYNLPEVVAQEIDQPTGRVKVERVLERVALPMSRIVSAIKATDPSGYRAALLRSSDGATDRGVVAEILLVKVSPKRPSITTVAFEFAVPASMRVVGADRRVSISAATTQCPAQCRQGDWFAGIGLLEASTPGGPVMKIAAAAAEEQRRKSPADARRVAIAAVEAVARLAQGQTAPPFHVFEVGQDVRILTQQAPCS